MEKYLNLKDITNIHGINKHTAHSRFVLLGITPIMIKHIKYYKENDVNRILISKHARYKIKSLSEQFTIIEYFLSHKENSSPDIAKICPLSTSRIDRIISDFLDNNFCIIAPSKINVY